MVRDVVPRFAVEAYERTFRGAPLPVTAYASMVGTTSYDRARTVACDEHYIVFPKASADACLVAAYALLKSQEAFERQVWYGSRLSSAQACFEKKYDLKDFDFWVKYGSWSCCSACGSFFFQQQVFF